MTWESTPRRKKLATVAAETPPLVPRVKLARSLSVGLNPTWNRALLLECTVLCAACVVLWAHGLSLVGDYRIDDAYITFAYSRNLAEGHGPIYGYDMRVEGYSNFLWMVLIAWGEVLRIDPLTFARLLGSVFFALTLGSTWLVARRLGGSVGAMVVTICLASSSDFHRAIQSGLETVAFCGFIAAGFCHYLSEAPSSRKWSLLWFSGAALTRIDGVVPFSLLVALEGLRWLLQGQRERLLPLIRWVAIGAAPVCAYWLWRCSYYGLLFPLTYYSKASLAVEMDYRGAAYVWNGLQDSGLWIPLLSSVFALGLAGRAKALLVAGFIVGITSYVIHVGGDWMPFNRMLLPVVAPLLLLSSVALKTCVPTFSALKSPRSAAMALLFAAGHTWCALYLSQASVDTPFEGRKLAEATHHANHTAALLRARPFVNAVIRASGDRLVTDYGGVFAYDTRATVIEMWGLANRDIALRGNTEGVAPIYGKTCVPCYHEFEPDYFHSIVPLLRGSSDFRSRRQLIQQIFQGPAIDREIGLSKNYVVGRVTREATGETLWFLERKREGVKFESRRVDDLVVDYPALR